jgi:hypothetical protein
MLNVALELLLESNTVFNRLLTLSNEAFVSVVKSVFTSTVESRLEEIDANLRFRVFKMAARAGNK